MSKSPTGVIPEELMRPRKLAEVMRFLQALPVNGDDKADLFLGWARMVGVKVNAAQRRAVRESGVDR